MKLYYRVRSGDTLWGIASLTLGNGQRDSEIYQLNAGHVLDGYKLTDENLIYPGMPLQMPADAAGKQGVYHSTDGGVTASGPTGHSPTGHNPPGTGTGHRPTGPGNGNGPTRSNGRGTGNSRHAGTGNGKGATRSNGRGRASKGAGRTAGGDKVTVDLATAGLAAQLLEALSGALDANVKMLQDSVSQLNGDGATLALPAVLQELQGRAPSDAGEMRAAYQIAERLNKRRETQLRACLTGPLNIGIGWDAAALGKATATADAQALTAALAPSSKDANAARAAIQDVASDLADQQGDSSYLTTFWSKKGVPQAAAKLATVLNRQDGHGAAVLSAQDQRILASFGGALAATTNAGALDQATFQGVTQAFASAPDLWSASMIFKYGPDGSAYGTGQGADLLAAVTRSTLDARESGHYIIPIHAKQLDGDVFDPSVIPALQRYDPVLTMLQRSAENKIAATQVLGGPGGGRYAHDLLNTPFGRYIYPPLDSTADAFQSVNPDPNARPFTGPDLPNFLLNQQTVAGFLDAATQGTDPKTAPPVGTGELGQLSARTALNLIYNTPGTKQIILSEPVRRALMSTYGRYMPDIAASLDGGTSTVKQYMNGPWRLLIAGPNAKNSPLPAFLQQICTNHGDAAMIQAETVYAFSQAFGWQAKNGPEPDPPNPSSDLASDLAQLSATIDAQKWKLGYTQAQMEDSRHQVLDNVFQMLPLPLVALKYLGGPITSVVSDVLLSLRFAATPWIAQSLSTDNAAKVAAQAGGDLTTEQIMVNVSMTAGLINQGVVSPPAGADWYKGKPPHGQVIPNAGFIQWWNANKGHFISNLPTLAGQPAGQKALPSNETSSEEFDRAWAYYGYVMGLAGTPDSWLVSAEDSGKVSAPAG